MCEYEVHTMNTLLIIPRMINDHECRRPSYDSTTSFLSVQTIAPEGFCTIGGKPKPCKLARKLKNKAQGQVDSFGSWLQENGRPDVF